MLDAVPSDLLAGYVRSTVNQFEARHADSGHQRSDQEGGSHDRLPAQESEAAHHRRRAGSDHP